MHVIHRPIYIITISENFFPDKQICRLPNFIALNLKEKSMKYDFFSKSMH